MDYFATRRLQENIHDIAEFHPLRDLPESLADNLSSIKEVEEKPAKEPFLKHRSRRGEE